MGTNNHGKVYVNSSGKRVMRITEVIKTLAKDQLLVWANMLGFKKVSYHGELERTANIGSLVHSIMEDFADDYTVTDLSELLDHRNCASYGVYSFGDQEEARNAVASFFKWYRKNSSLYKVVGTEVELIGEDVGGTTDLLLQSPWNSKKVIIGDYKTSKNVYFSMFLQAAGYIAVYEELHGENSTDGAVIFQLDKKLGKIAKPVFIDRENMEPYVKAFKKLLKLALAIRDIDASFSSDIGPFTTKDLDL